MTHDRKRALGDVALCAAVSVGAVVLLIGAAGLPPPRFDPLGSAALPRALAVLLLIFAAIVALRAFQRLRRAPPPADTMPGDAVDRDAVDRDAVDRDAVDTAVAGDEHAAGPVYPMRSVAVFVTLVAYVAALDVFRVPLVPASTVFMAIVGFVMTGNSVRFGGLYAVFGLVLSIFLSWVMTNFLYVKFG